MTEGLELYYERFYCQPCPLLSHLRDDCSSATVAPPNIVLYPLLALSLQTSGRGTAEDMRFCHTLAADAWDMLVAAYSSSAFGEDYLEGVCLLAQRDFAGGLLLSKISPISADGSLRSWQYVESRISSCSRPSCCPNVWNVQDSNICCSKSTNNQPSRRNYLELAYAGSNVHWSRLTSIYAPIHGFWTSAIVGSVFSNKRPSHQIQSAILQGFGGAASLWKTKYPGIDSRFDGGVGDTDDRHIGE